VLKIIATFAPDIGVRNLQPQIRMKRESGENPEQTPLL
jgi:hypothetical protein